MLNRLIDHDKKLVVQDVLTLQAKLKELRQLKEEVKKFNDSIGRIVGEECVFLVDNLLVKINKVRNNSVDEDGEKWSVTIMPHVVLSSKQGT